MLQMAAVYVLVMGFLNGCAKMLTFFCLADKNSEHEKFISVERTVMSTTLNAVSHRPFINRTAAHDAQSTTGYAEARKPRHGPAVLVLDPHSSRWCSWGRLHLRPQKVKPTCCDTRGRVGRMVVRISGALL